MIFWYFIIGFIIDPFELDPAHNLSTPGYSWDAILKFTDVNLKLIPDIVKYQFFESTTRRGISMIFKGYAEVTMLTNILHLLHTSTQIIYMGTEWSNFFQPKILDCVNPKDSR